MPPVMRQRIREGIELLHLLWRSGDGGVASHPNWSGHSLRKRILPTTVIGEKNPRTSYTLPRLKAILLLVMRCLAVT